MPFMRIGTKFARKNAKFAQSCAATPCSCVLLDCLPDIRVTIPGDVAGVNGDICLLLGEATYPSFDMPLIGSVLAGRPRCSGRWETTQVSGLNTRVSHVSVAFQESPSGIIQVTGSVGGGSYVTSSGVSNSYTEAFYSYVDIPSSSSPRPFPLTVGTIYSIPLCDVQWYAGSGGGDAYNGHCQPEDANAWPFLTLGYIPEPRCETWADYDQNPGDYLPWWWTPIPPPGPGGYGDLLVEVI